jgi:addiction module RelE/StbE family toxin
MKKIIWTDPAIEDLQAIFDFISNDSEYYAKIFVNKILDAVEKLTDLPEIGRIVPEYNRKEIREIIFQSYRIIYKIGYDQILILTVIHGRRDFTKIQEDINHT